MDLILPGLTFMSMVNLVFGSGRFEVSILAIRNTKGQREDGHCCAGSRDLPPCTMECQTFFSVCLQHFTARIPDRPSCTFGKIITPVLGGNSINESQLAVLNFFPLKLEFKFSWPRAFILVIDAWHDAQQNGTTVDSQRIHRVIIRDKIVPPSLWIFNTSSIDHLELKYGFRVICNEYYYGAACERMCRDRNDRFGHYVCDENGTIVCLPGWEGEFCENALCTEKCNSSHGFCDKPFECRCYMGWTGENCDKCKTRPKCLNGYCITPWQCLCRQGWEGQNCDIDKNYCSKHKPCLNGGTCNPDKRQNFTCSCKNGFGGRYCQSRVCYKGYCRNEGVCSTNPSYLRCECNSKYYGRRCEHRKVLCDDVKCLNNGTCQLGKYGARCLCPPAVTGSFCENKVNACLSNPCVNGGTCLAVDGDYTCKCQNNYYGKHCENESNTCRGLKCLNETKCGFMSQCSCTSTNAVLRCNVSLEPCNSVKCFNDGKCKPVPSNNLYCQCRTGFSGRLCEGMLDSCTDPTCINDQSSRRFTNYSVCICDHPLETSYCHVSLLFSEQSIAHTTPRLLNNVNSTSTLHSSLPNIYFVTFFAFVSSSLIIILNTRRWCLRNAARTPD